MLLLAWVSCLAWWVVSPRPLSSGRLSTSERDNGALCASAGPLAWALKMGLAGESNFFLISRFKGMRGAGREAKPPLPAQERGHGLRSLVGKRSKLSAVRGCASVGWTGLSVISLAGTVRGRNHT